LFKRLGFKFLLELFLFKLYLSCGRSLNHHDTFECLIHLLAYSLGVRSSYLVFSCTSIFPLYHLKSLTEHLDSWCMKSLALIFMHWNVIFSFLCHLCSFIISFFLLKKGTPRWQLLVCLTLMEISGAVSYGSSEDPRKRE